MAFFSSVLTRTSMFGIAAAAVPLVALAGCSNSGSASAPPAMTTSSAVPAPVATSESSAPAETSPPTTTERQPAPPPAARTTTAPRPAATTVIAPPVSTGLYPAPDVPRSSGSTPKKAAYLEALNRGGLPVTASGATELTVGLAICNEIALGGSPAKMKELLDPLGAVAASLSQSKLTGPQVSQLYLDSAKNNLC